MRKPISIPAAIVASLALLAVLDGACAAPAAANDCLLTPNGATPKGQHWYYHLDRASHRKCWYLRDVAAAAPAAASLPNSSGANGATKTSAAIVPTQQVQPSQPTADAAAPANGAPAAAAAADQGSVSATGSTPGNVASAVPQTAVSQPVATQKAMMAWPDASPPAPADAQQTDATADATPPDAAMTPAVANAPSPPLPQTAASPPPPQHNEATAQAGTAPESAAPLPVRDASGGLADAMVMGALAALLAAGVLAIFFAVGRRKRVVRLEANEFVTRFGSRSARRDRGWLRLPRRAAPPLQVGPIEESWIPEQVRMTRPSAPPR